MTEQAFSLQPLFKEGRSGVWITSQSSDVQQRLRLQTIFAQSPDVASTDSEYELE